MGRILPLLLMLPPPLLLLLAQFANSVSLSVPSRREQLARCISNAI